MKTQKSKIRYGVMTTIMVLCLVVCTDKLSAQIPVETTFTHHGEFSDPNLVPDGRYDLLFELYDDPNEGNLIGVPIELSDIEINEGSFTVELDFGRDVFDMEILWLDIGVRSSGTTEDYAFLDSRQELSPDPTDGFGLTTNRLQLPCVGYANYNYSGLYIKNEYTGSHSSSNGICARADGYNGKGVWGRASGLNGRGVYGQAINTGNTQNFGGYFVSNGDSGIGAYGVSVGWNGYGLVGRCDGYSGIGVVAYGKQYDFYAAGSGVDYGRASSIRWKTDIRPIDEPLDKVMKIRGVYFNWDSEHGGQHDVGMIAEEVGKVLPEVVAYEKNGIDADGMDYSKLTPLLVEAVKSLKSQLDEVKEQSTEKSQEIEELKIQLSGLQSLQRENAEICHRLDTLEAATADRFQLQKVE